MEFATAARTTSCYYYTSQERSLRMLSATGRSFVLKAGSTHADAYALLRNFLMTSFKEVLGTHCAHAPRPTSPSAEDEFQMGKYSWKEKICSYPILRAQRHVGVLDLLALLGLFAVELLAAEKFVVLVVAMLSLEFSEYLN